MMSDIIIFGGTFDPPHLGHSAMAGAALSLLPGARLIVIPTALPPHKQSGTADGTARLEMCRLAFNHLPAEVSDIELHRDGPSYTSDTMSELGRLYPEVRLYFLCGMDMFVTLDRWHESEKLKQGLTFLVAGRPGNPDRDAAIAAFVSAGGRALAVDMPPCEISSTVVRELLRGGYSAAHMLSSGVDKYILSNKLYKN